MRRIVFGGLGAVRKDCRARRSIKIADQQRNITIKATLTEELKMFKKT
jgi:hypothetical protein